MNKLALSFGHERQIYVIAVLISIFLSCLINYESTVINPDGICYLLSAQEMGVSSLKQAMQLCSQSRWPLYSGLIYSLAQIGHISYSLSAYLLNGCFSLISVIAFIAITKELGGTRRVMWLAALVILGSHEFNTLRDNIIRDHGFWAFYLVSFYCMLKYFRESKWTMAMAWNASLIVATLFRVEGAIFLVAMPFISWFYLSKPLKERAKLFFTLNIPLILFCIALATWQLFHPQQTMQNLGRISEIFTQLQDGFSILIRRFQHSKEALIRHVLPPESYPDTGPVLFFVWIGWYLYNVVLTLTWGYTALVLYAWKSRAAALTSTSALVVYGYIVVNIIMTFGFLAEHLFISKRYLVALALTLMLYIPFALNDLIMKRNSLRHRLFLILMVVYMAIYTISGVVDFGHSKAYVHTAGDWIATHVPANQSLYANDFQLMYYTQHFDNKIFRLLPEYLKDDAITQGKWKQYDYLALRLGNRVKGKTNELIHELEGMTPVQVFSNKRGNRVVVYKVRGE